MIKLYFLILFFIIGSCQTPSKSETSNVKNETSSSFPNDGDVCFSPSKKDVSSCALKLANFMNSASTSLDIAIYSITLKEIESIILQKSANQNIRVRIIVDKLQSTLEDSIVKSLLDQKVCLKYGSQSVMHSKFTIVDGKMVETGSFNYSNNANLKNHENQVYLSNPAIVDKYKKEFDAMWKVAIASPKLILCKEESQ